MKAIDSFCSVFDLESAQYEDWKLRELARIRRDKEELTKREKFVSCCCFLVLLVNGAAAAAAAAAALLPMLFLRLLLLLCCLCCYATAAAFLRLVPGLVVGEA